MFFQLNLDRWDEARATQQLLNFDKWVFRGQGDSSWALSSNFERRCEQFGLIPKGRELAETSMLREFQRRVHLYLANLPTNAAEWLALMQHHGAPSRLLDFTRSFYVAAFFAMDDAPKDTPAAIWAVNIRNLLAKARELLGIEVAGEPPAVINARHTEVLGKCLEGQIPRKMVLHVEPEHLNSGIALQQGLFLFPTDTTSSFENS
jgi:hypothetical protein